MKNNVELVPSLLAFNINDWKYFFNQFINNGLSCVHFDVMDYKYVNNIAYNQNDFNFFLNNHSGLKAHVHLMVMDPLNEFIKYVSPQTESICFHFDVYKNENDIFKTIDEIRKYNIKSGIAINPNFKLNDYKKYLKKCEFITIMGVYPGKGGQKFEKECLTNLVDIINWSKENKKEFLIEIDGGMNFSTIPLVIKNSRFIVSGSFLEKNIENIQEILSWMKKLV